MPVYEVEPVLHLGPVSLGIKLVRKVPISSEGITLLKQSINKSFEGRVESGIFANVVREDAVVLTDWSEDNMFGAVQSTRPEPVVGQAINKNPLLRRKLRYFP